MLIKESLSEGIKILNKNNIEEANLISKLFLASLLNLKKEDLIIYSEKELGKDVQKKFFDRNRKNCIRLPTPILNKLKRIHENELFCE